MILSLPETAAGAAVGKPHVSPSPVRLVVVDDSPDFLEVACACLQLELGNGLEVVGTAADGVEAIATVAALEPDIVLMDVQMPRMYGTTAAILLATSYPDVRILLMSAEDSPALRAQCLATGADAFIYKRNFLREVGAALGKATGSAHA